MRPLTLAILLFNSIIGLSQWSVWENIYSDSDIKVDLSYNLSNNSCDQGKANKLKYKIIGKIRNYDFFVTWKMDYVGCNNIPYTRQYSVNIGRNGILGEIKSLDDSFTGELINRFYDVLTSSTPKQKIEQSIILLSKDPSAIKGNSNIYRGEFTILNVEGGLLGSGSKWIWYTDSCGGQQAGIGSNLTVSPLKTTTYFVRAEGINNNTNCAQLTVNVSQLSTPPLSINGKTEICKNDIIQLSVLGGTLGLGAEWIWYTNDCSGNQIGKGTSINVSPQITTDYFVRAEGKLNKTPCVKISVKVYEKSIDPAFISGETTICEGEEVILKVEGGS
jgi:hypothetical protein